MATGTIELAPPDEGGDDRRAEVALFRQAELTAAAAGLLLESDTETVTDEMISDFFDQETADSTDHVVPEDPTPQQVDVQGGRALFVEGSENYGYNSPSFRAAMPGGIRNRVAGIEGRAFRGPWAAPYAGHQAIRYFVSRVAIP